MVYDENSGKVSLMIKAIGPGDEGEYTCTALNPYGEAICTVYISPEATKSVKKSKSGAKLHKSGSNKQIQMAQQQQQMMAQQQQQSSFSSSMQQSSMSSSSSFHQGKHSVWKSPKKSHSTLRAKRALFKVFHFFQLFSLFEKLFWTLKLFLLNKLLNRN